MRIDFLFGKRKTNLLDFLLALFVLMFVSAIASTAIASVEATDLPGSVRYLNQMEMSIDNIILLSDSSTTINTIGAGAINVAIDQNSQHADYSYISRYTITSIPYAHSMPSSAIRARYALPFGYISQGNALEHPMQSAISVNIGKMIPV